MKTPTPTQTIPQFARALSRAKLCAMQWAAHIAARCGDGPIGKSMRLILAAVLRRVARGVEIDICKQAHAIVFAHAHSDGAAAAGGARPVNPPAGARLRETRRVSNRRMVLHSIFARGLRAKDPRKIIAAILDLVDNVDVWLMKAVKRVGRGYLPPRPTLHIPAPIAFACDAPRPLCACADTS